MSTRSKLTVDSDRRQLNLHACEAIPQPGEHCRRRVVDDHLEGLWPVGGASR